LERKFEKIEENGKNPLDSSEIVVYPIVLENRIFCFVGARFSSWGESASRRAQTDVERTPFGATFQKPCACVAEVFEKTVERFGF
jgi:hypothetical protein